MGFAPGTAAFTPSSAGYVPNAADYDLLYSVKSIIKLGQ